MAITLKDIDLIFEKKFEVSNKNIIFIGDHFCNFLSINDFYIKKWNIEKIYKYFGIISDKEFLNKVFQSFGYEKLFICDYSSSPTVDFVVDLVRDDLRSVIKKKFGIIVDNGTSHYSTNINAAFKQIINICDEDSLVINKSDPSQFNRFPMQTTPDYIIDYFISEGFDIDRVEIIDGNGRFIKNYQMIYNQKGYYIYQILNLYQFFKYIVFILSNYFFSNKFDLIPVKKYRSSKLNNFKELKVTRENNTDIKNFIKSNFSIKKIKILRQLYMFCKNITNVNSGRLIISYVFKKNPNNQKLSKLSTSLHYHIKFN